MFNTSRSSDPRRRSRPYSGDAAARSSKLSLLSAFTVASSTSSGSTSTVTQESYSRSRRQHQERQKPSSAPTSSSRRRKTRDGPSSKRPASDVTPAEEKVARSREDDVFTYLVDETADEPRTESNKHGDAFSHALASTIDSDPEGYYRGHMSDSGISVGSGSMEFSQLDSPVESRLPPVMEAPVEPPVFYQPMLDEFQDLNHRWSWNGVPPPVPYPDDFISPPVEVPTMPLPRTGRQVRRVTNQPHASMVPVVRQPTPLPDNNTLSIRESDDSSRPMQFRAFSKLDSCLLLQMQKEIADLEKELKVLEDASAANKLVVNARRLASVDGSESETQSAWSERFSDSSTLLDHAEAYPVRRKEVFDLLRVKLERYYRHMMTVNELNAQSQRLNQSDVTRYRQWLKSHVYSSENFHLSKTTMSRLLGPDDGSDLVSLGASKAKDENDDRSILSRQTISTQSDSTSIPAASDDFPLLHFVTYCAAFHTLLPLLIFRLFVHGLLNRLIVVSLIVVSGLFMLNGQCASNRTDAGASDDRHDAARRPSPDPCLRRLVNKGVVGEHGSGAEDLRDDGGAGEGQPRVRADQNRASNGTRHPEEEEEEEEEEDDDDDEDEEEDEGEDEKEQVEQGEEEEEEEEEEDDDDDDDDKDDDDDDDEREVDENENQERSARALAVDAYRPRSTPSPPSRLELSTGVQHVLELKRKNRTGYGWEPGRDSDLGSESHLGKKREGILERDTAGTHPHALLGCTLPTSLSAQTQTQILTLMLAFSGITFFAAFLT